MGGIRQGVGRNSAGGGGWRGRRREAKRRGLSGKGEVKDFGGRMGGIRATE